MKKLTDYEIGLKHGLELAQSYISGTLKGHDNLDPLTIRLFTRMNYHLENYKPVIDEEQKDDSIGVH